jgi:hypothetical protein
MGQTISTRFEWSSAKGSAPDGSQFNLLAKSLTNDDLLTDLVQYIEHLNQNFPAEAKTDFKRPLIYASSRLKPQLFANDKLFVVQGNKCVYES